MYSINHINNPNQNVNLLEIKNSERNDFAKIDLSKGASLQELTLSNHMLIEDLSPLSYSDTYASSVLFPFANRIKDGTYNFDGNRYKLVINEEGNNNALHGLVYDKTFNIIDSIATKNQASITLMYKEENLSPGFPFTYTIQLEYILSENNLDLKVAITNTSPKPFPFTLGWHPYFISTNLSESYLTLESSKKVVFDDRMITKKTEDIKTSSLKLNVNRLDDCWMLDNTKVFFKTPDYNLQINSTEKNSFLQSYIPPRKNTIAIEPTTGISDSFNNKIGLQTLEPNKNYQVVWTLKLD
jgi:aldose 1-epimerase